MKKFKMNVTALVAMVVAAGTWAFTAPAEQQAGWYTVGVDEETIGSPIASPSGDCSTMKSADLCSVYLNLDENQPAPETVSEAEADGLIIDRAFRGE